MVLITKCPYFGTQNEGVRLTCNGMSWLGVGRDEVILVASNPQKAFSPVNYSATLKLFLQTLLMCGLGWPLSLREDEGDSNQH